VDDRHERAVRGKPAKTERFLWDYRRTIADLIAENHYGLLKELCNKNGLLLTAEAPGIGMPTIADALQCKGRTDVPMGEFWVNKHDDNGDTREAASGAHLYGKTVAAAESFTATPENAKWTNDPYSLKAQGDEQFCAGINRFVFHRYAHQPDERRPGMTMGPWGINFERSNTWWEPGRAWITYLSRCQYMLQRGLFVADLVYYYGEGAPRNEEPSQLNPPPPAGYDYDACNREVLLTRMSVRDGKDRPARRHELPPARAGGHRRHVAAGPREGETARRGRRDRHRTEAQAVAELEGLSEV
jgi:hypothetical protein